MCWRREGHSVGGGRRQRGRRREVCWWRRKRDDEQGKSSVRMKEEGNEGKKNERKGEGVAFHIVSDISQSGREENSHQNGVDLHEY